MNKKYFGTDGIRGTAFEKLNSKLAFKLGQAIAKKFSPSEIIIGQDTRLSSNMLAYGVAYGAALAGVNVKIAGVVSTPMVAYYSKVKDIIGVMITASHNPYTDNGIKVIKSGYKMLDEEEFKLESFIDDNEVFASTTFGSIEITHDVEDIYLKVYEDLKVPKTSMKITYDSANGANYLISKKVIESFASHTYQIGNTPDGLNINLNVGSTHLESIMNAVNNNGSDIGLSFDGDGDRILVIDKNGITYDGDYIVYIIAKYLKSKGKLKKDTVVLTQMSNPGMLKAFKFLGIKVLQTPVGDKYVSDAIMSNNLSIGGENSGHIIINDLLPSGDGLFAGVYILKILEENKTTLKEYTKEVEMFPQKMVNIKNVDKEILKHPEIIKLIDEVRTNLPEDSLLLVRPSGTEPLVRVTISCQDILELDKYMGLLVTKIQNLGRL
ncbi:phosphoglucosamine mutase [Acholeplasma laidlawii]|uniref:phosphoglucosamine mutase n=1 Tax=Acholeplasma laidlawii TaxID=2148 RepID=UPI003F93F598